MKILHTSDWHLNDRLGRIERQGDIAARLEEIAGYLEEHKVDVMVVAGDLLSQYNRIEEVKAAIEQVNKIFKPFLLKGGTIVAISGNHDREDFFRLLRFASDLASPIDPKQTGPRPNGRLYLVADPGYLLLEDKQEQRVQFILMPYPTPPRYLRDIKTHYGSTDEKNRLLQQEMIKMLKKLQNNYVDPRLPSVLVSHAHIRGSKIHNLYRITEREDIIFDPTDIPSGWAYGAFGHIHKPQILGETNHIRYSGSIERLDQGEKNDDKSVVLFEIGSHGRIDEPVPLPLNATPIYHIEITDPQTQIPILKDQHPESERALVNYKLIYKPGEHNRDAICQEIEKIFPRWTHREIKAEGSDWSLRSHPLVSETQSVPEVVQNFLQNQLKDHPQRDAVLALAEKLLSENF